MDIVNFGLAEKEPFRQVTLEEVEESCSIMNDSDEEESEDPVIVDDEKDAVTAQGPEDLDEMAESE